MSKAHPLLKSKWQMFFYTFLDTNKNKVIDWNDFELLFDKVKELRGEDSNEYKIVHDAMRMVWKGLLHEIKNLDIASGDDLDTSISIDEWNKMWEKFDPKHLQIWQWEYLKYMFFLLDSNGDKVIDKEEYAQVLTMFGIQEKDSKQCYEAFIGSTANKILDWGAFVKLWNEFFTSTDRKAPGSSLFGPW